MAKRSKREESTDQILGVVQEAEVRRRELIQEIEGLTARNVVNYSAQPGTQGGVMLQADILNLSRVISKKDGLAGLDLILNSPGGEPEVAEKIIITLRHYFDDDFRVIVPELAKSAATIVCLGADSILMGYCSELGPIDPQMLTLDPSGRYVFRSAHAIVESVDRYVRDVNQAVAAGKPIEAYLRLLDSHPELPFVEECRLAQGLSRKIAEKWLKAKMLADDPGRAAAAAETLSSADELSSHGRPIDYRLAKDELGLNVEYLEPDNQLWTKVWELHLRCRWASIQSKHVKIIESRSSTVGITDT